jgi:hypothetical protein
VRPTLSLRFLRRNLQRTSPNTVHLSVGKIRAILLAGVDPLRVRLVGVPENQLEFDRTGVEGGFITADLKL